jgi:hypothetical protein
MRLFHFSEECATQLFVPRPVRVKALWSTSLHVSGIRLRNMLNVQP